MSEGGRAEEQKAGRAEGSLRLSSLERPGRRAEWAGRTESWHLRVQRLQIKGRAVGGRSGLPEICNNGMEAEKTWWSTEVSSGHQAPFTAQKLVCIHQIFAGWTPGEKKSSLCYMKSPICLQVAEQTCRFKCQSWILRCYLIHPGKTRQRCCWCLWQEAFVCHTQTLNGLVRPTRWDMRMNLLTADREP